MILQASGGGAAPWVWGVLLAVGLLMLVGLGRAISILFWGVRDDLPRGTATASPRAAGATLALLAGVLSLSAAAGPLKRYTDAAARQLADRGAYARAQLDGGAQADTARPLGQGGVR
jgi:multicomponent K+:H+ antiporter subunit D